MSQNAQLFAGDLYISFETAPGVFGPAVLIRTDLLSVTTPSTKKQKKSKNRSDYGQAFVSIQLAEPTEFAITFNEMTRSLLAVQLSGELEALTVAGGAFVDLPVTAALDGWVDIGRKNIAVVGLAIKNSAGTTTYAKDVDYEINHRLGKLRAIPGGAITAAQALLASGTAVATTGTRINGARKYQHVLKIEGDLQNLANGADVEFLAPRAVVTSDQAFDFLQGDIAELKLKGTLEVPSVNVPPFVVEERVEA
jgi:hypothetical protein